MSLLTVLLGTIVEFLYDSILFCMADIFSRIFFFCQMKKVLLKLIYLYKKDPSLNSFSIHESKSISQKTIMNVVYIVTLYVVPLPIFVSFSLSHSIMFYNGKKITISNFV